MFANTNLSLPALKRAIDTHTATVYVYVVTSVKHREGKLVQTGSGPNWQGGVLTLCTCKHRLRSYLTPEQWQGVWLAGFTSITETDGHNVLVFLTRIAAAYPSQAALWHSKSLSAIAKREKNARNCVHGDLFEPRPSLTNEFRPTHYFPPRSDHDHATTWHWDINCESAGNRRSAMLAGDRTHTFLWDRPSIYLPGSIGRGESKLSITDLRTSLRPMSGLPQPA